MARKPSKLVRHAIIQRSGEPGPPVLSALYNRRMSSLPILYSFRRCPYAIRARLTLAYAGIAVELREVLLRDKPQDMLAASPKGTVPVLVLSDGSVIDESLEIMHWALTVADPDDWLAAPCAGELQTWIDSNDGPFKTTLDKYKYADRHPEHPAEHYRDQAGDYLAGLDSVLTDSPWLHGEHMGFADVALFPFIRQFGMVDDSWFATCRYAALRRWLRVWLDHPRFLSVMQKYPRWEPDQTPVLFPTA